MNRSISDEQLNAYIDDELDSEARAETLALMQQDETVSRAVCEGYRLKSMVRHAYSDLPTPKWQQPRSGRGYRLGWVAVLMLMVGLGGGWLAHDRNPFGVSSGGGLYEIAQRQFPAQDERRLLLHVTTDDGERFAQMLDDVELMLSEARLRNMPLQLEVLANGKGLDLFRSETSPFKQRIEQLSTTYDNVVLVACANAIRRLEQRGEKVQLLPQVDKTPSAMEKVIERMEKGWLYIKV